MRIETNDYLPESAIRKQETLANVCANLALRLTENAWRNRSTMNATLEREITEMIEAEPGKIRDTCVPAVMNTTRVEFFADKEFSEEEGRSALKPSYGIVLFASQTVDKQDIPHHVLDEIFFGEETIDLNDDPHGEEISRNALDKVRIERESMIRYSIDQDGEIDAYELGYTYSFNGENVHDVTYQDLGDIDYDGRYETEEDKGYAMEDIYIEPQLRFASSRLEQTAADAEQTHVNDDVLAEFQYVENVKSMMEFGGQSETEHRRQALAMLKLVTKGLLRIRELAEPKQL